MDGREAEAPEQRFRTMRKRERPPQHQPLCQCRTFSAGPQRVKSPVVHIVNKVAHHDFGELGALHVREMWRRCIDGVVFVRYSRLARIPAE